MAVTNTTPTSVAGLFKIVYADIKDLLPQGFLFQEFAPFEEGEKAGASIVYSIELSHENGITLAGSSGDVVTFNDAQAGVNKQATITPCEMFLTTGISTAALSRSNGDKAAFKKASQSRVKKNLKSHQRFVEHLCFYGQDTYGIGRVGYFTGTWQGVSFTNGGGALNGITFTAGVNTTSKHILLNPADIASGLWLGSEGMEVRERIIGGAVAASGAASGKVVSYNAKYGIVEVDFTPVAASAAASHCLELLNQNGASGNDFLGAKGILTKSGSLFGISNAVYGIWKGTEVTLASVKLTFARLIDAIIDACNYGLDTDVTCMTSFESWADLMTEQAALRHYDSSYKPTDAVNGTNGITFHSVNGSITVKPTRNVRRSDTFILAHGDWKRVGSTDITMRVPGVDDGQLLQAPTTQNVFNFRSYSDQAVICLAPARSVYISGIDPSSAS